MVTVVACLSAAEYAMATPGDESRNEGVIHGYVVDAATKKPVAGVVVSAVVGKTSVGKGVATDKAGYFKINQLPKGEMAIAFDKKGYKFLRKESIKMKAGDVVKLNVDIQIIEAEYSTMEFEHPTLRLIEGIF